MLIGGTMGTCSYVLTGTNKVIRNFEYGAIHHDSCCREWKRRLDRHVTERDELR